MVHKFHNKKIKEKKKTFLTLFFIWTGSTVEKKIPEGFGILFGGKVVFKQ